MSGKKPVLIVYDDEFNDALQRLKKAIFRISHENSGNNVAQFMLNTHITANRVIEELSTTLAKTNMTVCNEMINQYNKDKKEDD